MNTSSSTSAAPSREILIEAKNGFAVLAANLVLLIASVWLFIDTLMGGGPHGPQGWWLVFSVLLFAISIFIFGGYFTLHAMLSTFLHGETPFTCFVAASPTADYAGGVLAQAWESAATEPPGPALRVFIGHEDEEPGTMRTIHVLQQSFGSRSVDRLYRGADHMAVALPSFTDGLNFLWVAAAH